MPTKEFGLSIPHKWQEKYLIKRINEDDIEITLKERNMITNALNAGVQFIQIGKYTIMLNTIKSIDPVWPPDNIPPKPREEYSFYKPIGSDTYHKELINGPELELWEKLFGENKEGKIIHE